MKDKMLNNKQKEKLDKLKELWMKEAEEYFDGVGKNKTMEDDQKLHPHLDGGASLELLRIQKKYQKQIEEILGE